MKKFSYKGFFKGKIIFSQFIGTIGICFFSSISILFLFLTKNVPNADKASNFLYDSRTTLVCFAMWALIISWGIGSLFINYFPTIWVTEKQLCISAFLFFKVYIPWSNVIDIGSGHPPRGCVLVRARRITVFHRIFGWFYSNTLYPGFLIGKEIENRDDLIRTINNKIRSQ
jgi:hypothetical protein